MKLKTQKRLLNLTACAIVLAGCGGLAALVTTPTTESESDALTTHTVTTMPRAADSDASLATIDASHPVWSRQWRQPLYDPPPPPPVVAAPRPITVRLKGTIIEPDNSQAFVEMAGGTVELKRVGDPVTSDPEDGTIASIAARHITIKRADGEHDLKVTE